MIPLIVRDVKAGPQNINAAHRCAPLAVIRIAKWSYGGTFGRADSGSRGASVNEERASPKLALSCQIHVWLFLVRV